MFKQKLSHGILILLLIPIISQCYDKNPRSVLIINSYHLGYSWSDDEVSGIIETFSKKDPELQFYVEYLDCKYFPQMDHFPALKNLYMQKYKYKKIDVVLAVDNPALEFVIKNRDDIFPNSAIVFCGINGFTTDLIAGCNAITGVAETLDEVGTIKAAMTIHPGTKEFIVIVDNTITGQATKKELESLIPCFSPQIKFRILGNISIFEIQKELESLHENQLVLILSYSVDSDGKVFDQPAVADLLSAHSPVPIYAVHNLRLGHGIVGGSMLDGKLHGMKAADLVLRVISGENPSNIPVEMKSSSRLMFDYNQMTRFGIPASILPEGSIIINKIELFYEKHKTLVWIAVSTVTIQILIIILLALNILKRRKAEAALRESNQFNSEVITNAGEGIVVYDRELRYLVWNQFMESITGLPGAEILGKNSLEIFPHLREQGIDQLLYKALNGEVVNSRDTPYRVQTTEKSGWVLGTYAPHRNVSGKIIGVIGIIREITERKKMEDEIASEKEQLSVTLRSIGDGVITTDTSGRIVLMNKIAEQLIGWTQEESYHRPLEEIFFIINENTRIQCENPVQKVLATGKIINLANHTILVSKDGDERVIADSGAPIRDKESQIIGVVLVFRDITEKEKLEKELQKTQKLDSIGILAGGIAHDFNNILTGIIGNISLIKMYLNPKDKIFGRILEIEKASSRAKDLTQQLLTFSKGGIPVKKVKQIGELLKDAANFVVHGSNVKCEMTIPKDLRLVEVDEGQINQVINNIMINAVQAMPTGGIVKITAENVCSDFQTEHNLRSGNYVKITIEDSGVGIPEEFVNKIFDPFFTTKDTGSGLGLATSYSIVQKHDGYIFVNSTPGKGTLFQIYLSASEKLILNTLTYNEEPIKGEGKILIMDDEELVRDVAEDMFSSLGYEVEFSKDGLETIEKYLNAKKSRQYDLIILDLTIPGGMGGKDTIKKLLEIDPEVKALVSSGYSNDTILANFIEYGFKGRILKPYDITEVSKIINKVIKG